MSFTPRPRMGMGPPPGMQHRPHFNGPPGYGPPGMMHHAPRNGIIPMMRPTHMMNVPPRMPIMTQSNSAPNFISSPTTVKKDSPLITVFIGNISDRAPDDMIKLLLQRCGMIVSWKRVKGASGRLQAFGFCEYDYAISAMRCIRLLNELIIGEKKLLVKVDTKTQDVLDEFMDKQKKEKSEAETITFNEKIIKEDDNVKKSIDAVLRENSVVLATPLSKPSKNPHSLDKDELKKQFTQSYKEGNKIIVDKSLDELKLDKAEHNLITNEISFFRNSYKGESKESGDSTPVKSKDQIDSPPKDEVESSDPPRKESRHARDKHESRSDRRERSDRSDRDRSDKDRERSERDRSDKDKERSERSYRDKSDRSERRHERRRSRDRGRRDNSDDEDDVHERRRLERKMRDKENAYQTILKRWETRERRKMREYEKEAEKNKTTKSETKEEAKRLREFLEDYNDVRDDSKFFKGHLLNRRLKDRESELLNDERDRKREKEEINELRNRLIQEGKPDCELELIRIEKETDGHLVKCLVIPTDSEPEEEAGPMIIPPKIDHNDISKNKRPKIPSPISTPVGEPEESPKIEQKPNEETQINKNENQLSDKLKRKKIAVNDIFNDEDDDETDCNGVKKRKLVPLDYNGVAIPADAAAIASVTASTLAVNSVPEPTPPVTEEEKRFSVRGLIESIPTDRTDLFNFNIDWKMVDESLMERRIKPWINKKIVEYIGEEEPSLNEFICTKIMSNAKPQTILSDISMVLDDEAEVFVVKLWRLMIYESEAKRLGISKTN